MTTTTENRVGRSILILEMEKKRRTNISFFDERIAFWSQKKSAFTSEMFKNLEFSIFPFETSEEDHQCQLELHRKRRGSN
uniref:Uncharacterized protein n=1 Tax=Caenorhabditis tropicalis TaxID=1561998 RepID=A0A1I7U7X2_9PELO